MRSLSSPQDSPDHRRGIFFWWLRLTAPAGAEFYERAATRQERDRLRRAGLTSYIAPFVFVSPLLLIQQATDTRIIIGILGLMCASLVALVLNRRGHQIAAALLLVVSMDIVIEGSLLTAQGGLGSGWLLTFDLFVIPLIASGVLLSRDFLWFFLLFHIALILGDFYLLPHTTDLNSLILQWHGPAIAFARPILVQVGACLLTFAAVRSMDQAIRRADRAEELTILQQSIAKEKQQLEDGIQEIVKMLSEGANGRLIARSSMPQDHVLWKIASNLNTLFSRLQSSRNAETTLRQANTEAQRLHTALQSWREGQQQIVWPLPSGTIIDPLLSEIRTIVGAPPSSDTSHSPRRPR
jgi:hypothetical protein